MKNFNLKKLIKPNKTLLGVGPMSLNCVKAASEVANKFKFPIMLIASRRQIDLEKMEEVMLITGIRKITQTS